MKKILAILIMLLGFSNCKSSKHAKKNKHNASEIITKKSEDRDTKNSNNSIVFKSKDDEKESIKTKAEYIIDYAKNFEGVRYKWGGTTASGMDCSGLIFESFRVHDIILPRISRDMAKKGNKIKLKKVLKGDLLFFKTGNRRNSINHVGLIVDIRDNDIKFIHATTSNGVIISGLNETYWLKAFYEARRIL